ncbi:hypothetical protein ACIRQY_19670 [Streptomyces sp. NPDC101490]
MPVEHVIIATLGAAIVALVAVSYPELVPALTLSVAVWVALTMYLKR